MEKTIQELKTIIRDLILEVGDLKERVTLLEKGSPETNGTIVEIIPTAPLEAESYENLGKIYNEGYHICHAAYGQIRHEECLFCVAFLEKE